jgi:hypothetical protein
MRKFLLFVIVSFFNLALGFADVSVTPASGGTDQCAGNGFVTIGNIIIAETAVTEFGSTSTIDLVLPTGFVYNTAAPITVNATGTDISIASSTFTDASRFRIEATISGTSDLNDITISGIEIQAITPASSGNILIQENANNFLGLDGSNGGNLSSVDFPVITKNPSDKEFCEGESASFSIIASGTLLTYQWQRDDGGGFTDIDGITDGGVYTNFTTNTLNISDVSGLHGFEYRCVVTENGASCNVNTSSGLLTVNALPSTTLAVTGQDTYLCYNGSTSIEVAMSEVGVNYQLKSGASNIGSPVASLGGTIGLPTGALTATTTFTVEAINGTSGCSVTLTDDATVNVNGNIILAVSTLDNNICVGESVDLLSTHPQSLQSPTMRPTSVVAAR